MDEPLEAENRPGFEISIDPLLLLISSAMGRHSVLISFMVLRPSCSSAARASRTLAKIALELFFLFAEK